MLTVVRGLSCWIKAQKRWILDKASKEMHGAREKSSKIGASKEGKGLLSSSGRPFLVGRELCFRAERDTERKGALNPNDILLFV